MRRVRFSALEYSLSSENLASVSLPKDGKLASTDAYTPNCQYNFVDLLSLKRIIQARKAILLINEK